MNYKHTTRAVLGFCLAIALRAGSAGEVTVPNSFTAGTPARAAQINANFSAVATAVNENAARISALETSSAAPDFTPRGNLVLPPSSASTGNVVKGGRLFIHNFGSQNTFVGEDAGNNTMTRGGRNTGMGIGALGSIDTAIDNTAVGALALKDHRDGDENTAVGVSALEHHLGRSSTAVGAYALGSNKDGHHNVAVGSRTLSANQSASYNTAVGVEALYRNSVGEGNTAIGAYALSSNTGAHDNTAVGFLALNANTGIANTATGAGALSKNTVGARNTAYGWGALESNTDGESNTAVGSAALYRSNAAGNTAVGHFALERNTTGRNNVAIGTSAGSSLTTGDGNIDIGSVGVAAEANTTRIGTAQQRTFIAGIRGVTTGVVNALPVVIDGNGQLGTVSSSRTVKDHIADMDESSSVLAQLRPVTFYYRSDQSPDGRALQYGLVAEEVAEVAPELVARSADGAIETVYYQFLPPMLLNEWQRQQRAIATLEARVAELEQTLRGERR